MRTLRRPDTRRWLTRAQVAAAYKCTPLEGVLSHQMKKHVIDANKVIINKASIEHSVKEARRGSWLARAKRRTASVGGRGARRAHVAIRV